MLTYVHFAYTSVVLCSLISLVTLILAVDVTLLRSPIELANKCCLEKTLKVLTADSGKDVEKNLILNLNFRFPVRGD